MFRSTLLIFLLLSFQCLAKSDTTDTINIRNLKTGISLENFWKYKYGDSIQWASVDYDDSQWRLLAADTNLKDIFNDKNHGIVWFRSSFFIDSLLDGTPLALETRTNGACEVFIDGKMVYTIGKVGRNASEVVSGFSIRPHIIPVPFNSKGRHRLALRLSSYEKTDHWGVINTNSDLNTKDFSTTLRSMQKSLEESEDITTRIIPVFFSGVFIVLSLFHFILFLYYRKNRLNIYYSFFTFFLFIIFFATYITLAGTDFKTTKFLLQGVFIAVFTVPLFFIRILYEVFYARLPKMFWILTGLLIASLITIFFVDNVSFGLGLLLLFNIIGFIETIRIIIRAFINKRPGSRVFVFGLLFPLIGTIALGIISLIIEKAGYPVFAEQISDHTFEFFGYSLLMSVSISMTIYIGRDIARMNKKLHQQIKEIKSLLDRTIEQETEKKKILENQKEELERKVIVRTEEVVRQKAVIELKNKDILDNLLYARRIQDAILPEIKMIYEALRESFIIYWPKDIVSGDFYAFSQRDGKVIIAAADCTGHGVTGAFMSMIGSSVLNQIVNEKGITEPAAVLNNLNIGIAEALKQNETDVNDGMDISLCTFDLKSLIMQYAGANRPLWMIRNGEMHIIRPDKFAIGGFRIQPHASFTNHVIRLNTGDSIYLFSDGYADQFGGPKGRKILSKRFRELLLSIHHLPMNEQQITLTKYFNEWKGHETQVDDVLVIGIRI